MKVSVVMITYNHENYLIEAINGVLNQITNFDFELIIANDNSPDDTDIIIKKLIHNHPAGNKIKYLHNKENIGMMPNFVQALQNCIGEYVALCEGDDYWTDNQKLQKQVDFLDQNKQFAICFHNVQINKKDILSSDTLTEKVKSITTIKNLAKRGNYIHTCSVVYRNHLIDQLPDYFQHSPIGDYFIHMLNARKGKIHKMEDNMAVYRIHDTSYWSSQKESKRNLLWIDFLIKIKPNFKYEIQSIIDDQIEIIKGTYKRKSIFQKIKNKIVFFVKDTLI